MICSVSDCERPHHSRGLCQAHYRRLSVHGDVQANVPSQPYHAGRTGLCSVQGCSGVYRAKGLCAEHYNEKFKTDKAMHPCAVIGCTRPQSRRGWCVPHYQRWSAHGDPLAGGPSRVLRGTGPTKWEKDQIRREAKAKTAQFTGDDREYVLIIKGDPCSYCGAPMEHVDHIVPFADGGPSDWTNLAPACAACNHRKSRKSLLAFLLETAGGDEYERAA